jgi:hypothetical protein
MSDQDPHLLHEGHHPTPFTAAEIRAASHVGRTIRQLIEVDGQPDRRRVQQWVAIDEDGGDGIAGGLGANGSPTDVQPTRSRWIQLQGHASFPIASTTIDEVTLDSPMGQLDCLRYTRRDGDGTDTFWFARAYPGMPVRIERTEGGRLVERVTMLSNEIEPPIGAWSPG